MTLRELTSIFNYVTNQIKMTHLWASGPLFDSHHKYSNKLYNQLSDDLDTILEITLEFDELENFSLPTNLPLLSERDVVNNWNECITKLLTFLLKALYDIKDYSAGTMNFINDLQQRYEHELLYFAKRRDTNLIEENK